MNIEPHGALEASRSSELPLSPKVSLVIPFFNACDTLERSLRCALSQTERDIEVVCVDDGSDDGSARIVTEAMAEDGRVKLVSFERNQGRLYARQAGVGQAQGAYLMFLDADDELLPDAVETALSARMPKRRRGRVAETGFDIVQFGFDVRYAHYASAEEKRFNRAFCRPPREEAFGDDVVHMVFRDRKTTWSLCGKLMRSSVVKRAVEWMERNECVSLQAAEDAALFFMIAYYADSYKGLPDYEGYVYHIDIGGSGASCTTIGLDQFERSCHYADAIGAIDHFVSDVGAQRLALDVEVVRYEHLLALADKALRFVDPADRPQAFSLLVDKWSAPDAVAGVSDAGWFDPAGTLEAFAASDALRCPPRQVKTVAAYHHVMGHGGAERATAMLARLWSDAGYRVVLLSDGPRSSCVHDLPDSVVWVELPAASTVRRNTYSVRARALARALEEHQVDVLVHHQWWSPLLSWDMMLAKSCRVPVCIYVHSMFSALFREGRPSEYDFTRLARHADGIVALSEDDCSFWKQFNPRVWAARNLPTCTTEAVSPATLAGARIVWVGRFTPWDKQPAEALEIFARVLGDHPEATLTMVGAAPDDALQSSIEALVRDLGIAHAVRFAGESSDVMPFYQDASVHLLTSAYEGWCLTLWESKVAGVPCVLYDMPYLTLVKEHRGMRAVAQGDRDAAARAVCDLLEDREARVKMGEDARAHAKELESFDYQGFWDGVFLDVGKGSVPRDGFEEFDAWWDLMLEGQKAGIAAARADEVRLFMEESRTYKLGDAIIKVPRNARNFLLK
ncbi:MAG: glycosyltransferase [Eggerthellaceae bacterium]|nr:glycosyltransferase [Eggerthellaceae bacterium]